MHLARHLAGAGHEVSFLCEAMDREVPGVRVVRHEPVSRNPGQTSVDYQIRMGVNAARALDQMRRVGDQPDIIFGHAGWGSLLFAKEVLPRTPVLGYCEFFYRPRGADVGFDPSVPVTIDDAVRLKARNFAQSTTLLEIEAGISPTGWQREGYPAELRKRIGVVHDGIDTGFCVPNPAGSFTLPNGRRLVAGDPVVTFAARDLEPYRGFPQFMRAAARLARQDANVVFVVAGGDGASYGALPADGRPWRDVMMEETGLDPSRIHFVGTVPHEALIRLFQVSAAHVYLTYPFVLSWSMLEAMATGVLLIASDTAPVREFVREDENGVLVPFFDAEVLASAIARALHHPSSHQRLRQAARETIVSRVALDQALQTQVRVLEKMLNG